MAKNKSGGPWQKVKKGLTQACVQRIVKANWHGKKDSSAKRKWSLGQKSGKEK